MGRLTVLQYCIQLTVSRPTHRLQHGRSVAFDMRISAAATCRYFRSISNFGYSLAPITSTYHLSQTSRENAAIALHEPYPEPQQQLEGAIAGAAESSDLRSSPGRTAAVRRALDSSHITAHRNELRQSLASSAARALAAQDQPNMLRRSTYKTL